MQNMYKCKDSILGENSENQKIEMTVPVTTKMIVNKVESGLTTFRYIYDDTSSRAKRNLKS